LLQQKIHGVTYRHLSSPFAGWLYSFRAYKNPMRGTSTCAATFGARNQERVAGWCCRGNGIALSTETWQGVAEKFMTEKPGVLPFERAVAFDLETTGLSPKNGDRVIEIGAVAVENGKLTDEFHSLIHTGKRIHWGARHVHGISSKMLVGQPLPDEIFPRFRKFIASDPLVAHNAAFDISFLAAELSRLNLSLNNPCHCTLKLSRSRNRNLESHKLVNVARYLLSDTAVENITLHRALADARLTAQIWLKMMESEIRNG